MPAVELVRPLRLTPTGGTELTILNRGSNNVYYGQSPTVSSTNRTGTLNVGESLAMTTGYVWVVAEATPVILDLKEKEVGSGTGGISRTEGDARYARSPQLVVTVTAKTSTVTLPTVATATMMRIVQESSATYTMPSAVAGTEFYGLLIQDSSGSRVPTFSSVKWARGSVPTEEWSTEPEATDLVAFICVDGTNWLGTFIDKGYA